MSCGDSVSPNNFDVQFLSYSEDSWSEKLTFEANTLERSISNEILEPGEIRNFLCTQNLKYRTSLQA
jgi:hypothetical protein